MSRSLFRRTLGAALMAFVAATYAVAVVAPSAHALPNVVAAAGSDTTQDLMGAIITHDSLAATNIQAGNVFQGFVFCVRRRIHPIAIKMSDIDRCL